MLASNDFASQVFTTTPPSRCLALFLRVLGLSLRWVGALVALLVCVWMENASLHVQVVTRISGERRV